MKIYKSKQNILKFSIGQMIPTETVQTLDFDKVEREDLRIQNLISTMTIGETLKMKFTLSDLDAIYGLGQNMRGLNKRGYVYESFCSDDPNHTPEKKSLYGAHNFFIVNGEQPWGLYVDFAGKIVFDMGFEDSSLIQIEIENPNVDIYFFEGSMKEISKQFRTLIGQSYVPPKWAFGYQQSRWSYEDETAVKHIASKFKEHDIPYYMRRSVINRTQNKNMTKVRSAG